MKHIEVSISGTNPGEPAAIHVETKRQNDVWARDSVVEVMVGTSASPAVHKFDIRDDQRISIHSVERRVRFDKEQRAAIPMTAAEIEAADAAARDAGQPELTDDEAQKQRIQKQIDDRKAAQAAAEKANTPQQPKVAPAPPQPKTQEGSVLKPVAPATAAKLNEPSTTPQSPAEKPPATQPAAGPGLNNPMKGTKD